MADNSSDDGLAKSLADYPDVREALIRKLNAEALAKETEAEKLGLERDGGVILLSGMKRDEADTLAEDRFHHVYQFSQQVGDGSVANCIERLSKWSRQDPGCDIEIIFNSPGGGVIAGMALFDFILYLRRKGHNITTLALGHAASMAGILLQAGTTRAMGSEAWLLIHEISFSAVGKIGEVEDTTEWVKRICKRVVKIFADRSKLSAAQIEKRWKRQDWWISSDDCLKWGLVDEVR